MTTDLSVGNLAYFGKSAGRQAGHGQREFVTLPNQSRWGRPPAARGQPDCEMVNEGFNLSVGHQPAGSESAESDPVQQHGHDAQAPGCLSRRPRPAQPPLRSKARQARRRPRPPRRKLSPPAISTPGGQTPPPVQTPAATPAPAVLRGADPAPGGEHFSHDAAPAATPDGGYGPGMVPVE